MTRVQCCGLACFKVYDENFVLAKTQTINTTGDKVPRPQALKGGFPIGWVLGRVLPQKAKVWMFQHPHSLADNLLTERSRDKGPVVFQKGAIVPLDRGEQMQQLVHPYPRLYGLSLFSLGKTTEGT
jgi:hypothetical protein